jgi:hypothetical protein
MAAVVIATGLATAAASSATASTASAAVDPVKALQKQFAKKGGVRLVDDLGVTLNGKKLLAYRSAGVVRFGPSGVAAADVTTKGFTGGDSKIHTITLGPHSYVQTALFDDLLPEGKSWIREPVAAGTVAGFINVLDPRVLKAVLATTKSTAAGGTFDGTKTLIYRGSVTLKQLAKVSPALRELTKQVKSKKPLVMPWKLWVGRDGLPRRFSSSLLLASSEIVGDSTMTVDTRFKSWGVKPVIKAPPADQVIDIKDVGDTLPDTEPTFVGH